MLRLHIAGGMRFLALMVARLVVRVLRARPAPAAPAPTTRPLIDRLAPLAHRAFYSLVTLMVATGYATANRAGLPAIDFGRSGAPVPATVEQFPTFIADGYLAGLLATLIALRVLAAWDSDAARRRRRAEKSKSLRSQAPGGGCTAKNIARSWCSVSPSVARSPAQFLRRRPRRGVESRRCLRIAGRVCLIGRPARSLIGEIKKCAIGWLRSRLVVAC